MTPSRCFIAAVDLPSSIPYSFCNLLYRYPEAKFCLPNEAGADTDFTKYSFVFMTNEQTGLLEANQFDIGVNTMSFAEMKQNRWETRSADHSRENRL